MQNRNKLLTIMLIILVCITLLGVVALLVVSQLNKKDAAEEEPTIDEIVESSIDIPEITTNLAGNKFIRISLKIQSDGPKSAEELTKRDFQIKNVVITELSEMTPEDLEGKQGKATLLSSIKSKINELMDEGEIQQVYITSYIIQ